MMTERQRCEALTAGGCRCHKPARPGERFCWVHLRYPPRTVAEPTSPTAKPPAVR